MKHSAHPLRGSGIGLTAAQGRLGSPRCRQGFGPILLTLPPVNLGQGTAPETFEFARNWWYCIDAPERSVPRLPVAERIRPDGTVETPLDRASLAAAIACRRR